MNKIAPMEIHKELKSLHVAGGGGEDSDPHLNEQLRSLPYFFFENFRG